MIVFYGGSGGNGFVVLLMFALFLLLPFLLLRGARHAVVLSGPGTPVPTGPPRTVGGWEPPPQPQLPPVSPADVTSLRDRLAHDVRTLEPGDDPVSRQAMADASERYSTCSTLLERARSDAQLRTAWLAAVEGLTATRLVRSRLGLDPGPEIPMPPTGPQLQAPAHLELRGRGYSGGPSYTPGRPHWFPGGLYGGRWVPGGWYDAPFWPSAVVLGGLGGFALGGLGGLALGGAVFGDELYGGDFGDGGFGGFGGGGGWEGGGFDGSDGWGSGSGGGWDWGGGGGDFGGGGGWGD